MPVRTSAGPLISADATTERCGAAVSNRDGRAQPVPVGPPRRRRLVVPYARVERSPVMCLLGWAAAIAVAVSGMVGFCSGCSPATPPALFLRPRKMRRHGAERGRPPRSAPYRAAALDVT